MNINIIFTIGAKNCVYPCADDNGQELEQGQYRGTIGGNAYEEHGIPQWKYMNGACVERTQQEIDEDIADLPIPEPTEIDQMQADIDYLTMENEYLDEVTEQQQADIDYCLMLLDEE